MQQIDYLSALPVEIQRQIFNKTELAIKNVAVTSTTLRKTVVTTQPAFKCLSFAFELLKQSYQLIGREDNAFAKKWNRGNIACQLATFDKTLAFRIVQSIPEESERLCSQQKLCEAVLKFDKEEAFKIVAANGYPGDLSISVAREFAIQNKARALDIANLIKSEDKRREALMQIAVVRASLDLTEALDMIKSLNISNSLYTCCQIIKALGEKDRRRQQLVTEFLKMVDSIPILFQEFAFIYIVDVLSSAESDKALEIEKVILEKHSSPQPDHVCLIDNIFLLLIKFFLPLEPQRAMRLFSLMKITEFKDQARLAIGLYKIDNDLEEAQRMADSMKNKHYKDILLRDIAKKQMKDEEAHQTVFSSMQAESLQQALALGDIFKRGLLKEPEKVKNFLAQLEYDKNTIIGLFECVKDLLAQGDSGLAGSVLDRAVVATHSLKKEGMEKAAFFTEIAQMICQWNF